MTSQSSSSTPGRSATGYRFPPSPEIPSGPLAATTVGLVDQVLEGLPFRVRAGAIAELGGTGDPRIAWLFGDMLPFANSTILATLQATFETLTGADVSGLPPIALINHLIAWDVPAYPGYLEAKRQIFTAIEPAWQPFFDDPDAEIDWRLVSWGGVLIDDRPEGRPDARCRRGCIPALDDPVVTDASQGDWYPDEALIFGVVIGGEARAYPKNLMEVHEMVNDSLGGRRFAMPYCTLCGAAQAFFTDTVAPFEPLMRTSGLLSRSNKVMFDLPTMSVFDTFTGRALSGPLHDAAVVLPQASVVTTTWRDWRETYPDTTILASDGGLPGRTYPLDPLRGRDDDGPIFPVGQVDERLAIQDQVLGVVLDNGAAIAFPVGPAVLALQAGEAVVFAGIEVRLDAGGLRAYLDGQDARGHQAFWFAWSQFHPDTLLWSRP